jgi:glycosyltransferase involved in cell wall biosynthesis
MSLSDIHPVVITRDAARTIEQTLASLAAFPRVTVYDNGSTDATVELCERFPNTRVVTGEFFGFGSTYNHAADLAAGDWILSIHADEHVSGELVASLAALELADPATAYAFERHNLFMGKDMRWAGWGKHWMVRLYNRRTTRFNDAPVHEKLQLPGNAKVAHVRGTFWHDAVTDIDQFLQKVSHHTELRRHSRGRTLRPGVILVRAWWAFFRTYMVQLGVLEGWRGMVIAVSNANGSFYKHMKRYVDANLAKEQRQAGLVPAARSASPPSVKVP